MQDALNTLMTIEGALGCALGDYTSGMVLGTAGGGLDLEAAVAANTEVIRAKMRAAEMLGLDTEIEDILITLGTQYHVMRPMSKHKGVFIYLALDRKRANLALARMKVREAEALMKV
jgi:hypothetical protein